MWGKLIARLEERAQGKTLLALFLLLLLFTFVIFPWRSSELPKMQPPLEKPTLDTQFGYSVQTVYETARQLGEQGRMAYALTEVSVDLVYPVLYSLFLSLLMLAIFRRLLAPTSAWLRLALLPVVVPLFDYAENFSIVFILLNYPTQFPSLAQAANVFTLAKWTVGVGCVVIILLGGIGALIRRVTPSVSQVQP